MQWATIESGYAQARICNQGKFSNAGSGPFRYSYDQEKIENVKRVVRQEKAEDIDGIDNSDIIPEWKTA
jgi:hypothetical protein